MNQLSETPETLERLVSQLPAADLLVKLGFCYLPPAEARAMRGGRLGEVLLEPILREQLAAMNRVAWKGVERPFTADAIEEGIAALRDLPDEGLIQTSEKVFDLLSLGKSLPQTIGADTRGFTLRYVDWEHPERNVFHVTEEYAVARTRPDGRVSQPRLDIVLFVNGIPFSVIECKKRGPKMVEEAIGDFREYQRESEIPKLFWYAQVLLATNMEEASYGTARTPAEFWAQWREGTPDSEILAALHHLLDPVEMAKMHWRRAGEEPVVKVEERTITAQDRAIYGLLRPARLLELVRGFIIYDAGVKKIARHQQYAAVKRAVARVLERGPDGSRNGGLVWHTQGSGKSLTMVMLAKALALHPDIPTPRLILVTDRVELDKQIADTFRYCGHEPQRARDGKHLRELIEDGKAGVITTIVNKFEAALKAGPLAVRTEATTGSGGDFDNTFVLVDEAHRSHFGAFHALMKKALKKACYIGFTGTPVVKGEKKNNLERFGAFIHTYMLDHAVTDKAVVPLLYEGRHVEQDVDEAQMDLWFDRYTRGMSDDQRADFKKKFANADHLNRSDNRLKMIAYDVAAHFTQNFGNQGCKGQFVAPRKDIALRYKEIFDEIGRMDQSLRVSTEVLISGPSTRDDEEEELPEAELPRIEGFWKEMMSRFGTEERYNESLTNRFKGDGDPQIIIVVSKLLTGFDAPANTVLYLDKKLTGHTLLQAIARVNRRHEGKDFGYIIDYYGVLGDLSDALTHFEALADFEESDLGTALTALSEEVKKLPQSHTDLLALFSGIKNRKDHAAYKVRLEHQDQRDVFYERLSRFGRLLHMALTSAEWQEKTAPEVAAGYKKDLRYFLELRAELKRQYAEVVDYSEYERRIQNLIDRHIGATEVTKITPLVNIFDKDAFEAEVEKANGAGSKAETIAHRMQRTIREKWEEDPAFYKRFSKLLEEVIEAYRARRISENDYLTKVKEKLDQLRNRSADGLPASVTERPAVRAFFGTLRQHLGELESLGAATLTDLSEDLAHDIEAAVQANIVVDWENNHDARNSMTNAIEDCLLDAAAKLGFRFPPDHGILDRILDEAMRAAGAHFGRKRGT
jgi:type I restriction enzyme R subunit